MTTHHDADVPPEIDPAVRLLDTPPDPSMWPEDWTEETAGGPVPAARKPKADDQAAGKSVATQLVELAEEMYFVFLGSDGEPYAVEQGGSSIALPLRGRTGLRQRLSHLMYVRTSKAASASALADCLNVLEGKAFGNDRQTVSLRVERSGDGLVIDMGTADGRMILVGPDGWKVVHTSDVLFRRTALTGAMPEPDPNGTLDAFRAGLNVSDENFRLIVGWMLHAFIPDEPHPVLGLVGEQGTAKTTGAKHIAGAVDPSPAPTRTAPKDLTDWAVTASGSWVVTLDNISSIQPWFSDALCKAVTGDALTKRALYTDSDVSVLAFLRPIIMTSIEAGALRGDLAERMLPVELERIANTARRTEKSIRTAFEEHLPQTLGALLNLLTDVMRALPDVHLAELPRMADFARFLAALDQVTGWHTREDYEETFADLAEAVIDGDPFAAAIRERLRFRGFDGTAAELLKWAAPPGEGFEWRPPRGWPKTPRGASGALKRAVPALLASGIEVEFYKEAGGKRTRKIAIRRGDGRDGRDGAPNSLSVEVENGNRGQRGASHQQESSGNQPSLPSLPSLDDSDQGKRSDGSRDGGGTVGVQPSDVPSPPLLGPNVGSCAKCGQPTLVRGQYGNPHCPDCR